MHKTTIKTVIDIFKDNLLAVEQSSNFVAREILMAALSMVDTLKAGNKILACGNGGSATDAMHFSAELLNRFVLERDPLPAIALGADSAAITAIGNDYDFSQVFSKQIMALGKPGDILLALSTSGNSANILEAIKAAHSHQMQIVALSGNSGGMLSGMIQATDINICVPSQSTARIQEVHGLAIHCFCEIIDQHFN